MLMHLIAELRQAAKNDIAVVLCLLLFAGSLRGLFCPDLHNTHAETSAE
jgi:hypothetical protein